MNVMDNVASVRKRKRIRFSCLICRQRKLKCDRGFPCATCASANLGHLCRYEEPAGTKYTENGTPAPIGPVNLGLRPRGRPRKTDKSPTEGSLSTSTTIHESKPLTIAQTIIPITSLQSETFTDPSVPLLSPGSSKSSTSSLLGTNSNASLDTNSLNSSDEINFSQAQLTTNANAGQSIFQSLHTSALLARCGLCFKDKRIAYLGAQSSASLLYRNDLMKNYAPQVCKAKKENFKKVDIIQKLHRQQPRDFPLKSGNAETLVTLFLRRYGEDLPFDSETPAVGIFSILPVNRVCEFLLDRFLSHVNPLYYIIDPFLFDKDIKSFYQTRAAVESGEIKDSDIKDAEMRIIALVTIMIRLARLTLPEYWKPSDCVNDTQYDKDFYYGPKLKKVAESLLSGSGSFKRSNLIVLQTYLCMKIHHTVSPEDGDGLDGMDSLGLSGIIIEMSKHMGLHRDPKNFDILPAEKAHLWRMLWGAVVILDSQRACENQIAHSINLRHSDTELVLQDTFDQISEPADNGKQAERIKALKIYSSLGTKIRNDKMRLYLLSRDIMDSLLSFTPISPQESMRCVNQITEYENSELGEYTQMVSALRSEKSDNMANSCDTLKVIKRLKTSTQIENFILIQQLKITFYRESRLNLPSSVNMEYEALLATFKIGDCFDLAIHCKGSAMGLQWYINRLIIKWCPLVFLLLAVRFLDELKYCKLGKLSPYFQGLVIRPLVDINSSSVLNKQFHYEASDFSDLRGILQRAIKLTNWAKGLAFKYFHAYKFIAVASCILEAIKEEIHTSDTHKPNPEFESLSQTGSSLVSSQTSAAQYANNHCCPVQHMDSARPEISSTTPVTEESVSEASIIHPGISTVDHNPLESTQTQQLSTYNTTSGEEPTGCIHHILPTPEYFSSQFKEAQNSNIEPATVVQPVDNKIINSLNETRYHSSNTNKYSLSVLPLKSNIQLQSLGFSESSSVTSNINPGDEFFSGKHQPFDQGYSESLFQSFKEGDFFLNSPMMNQDILSWFDADSVDDDDIFDVHKGMTPVGFDDVTPILDSNNLNFQSYMG
ncbi:hypothetical protein NADFUDRAFT_48657 [Nadsonia fulvescens var. elongata DSM 6958]|uniref:Zn(2)-C6 fungal-type domain-containing protein n=1 Tax=Nadsonia fulvescens var. elongata DSM 6958 TaxID=857566 RepID=A0A1E3PT50_9ASCO|nr:hypothetical protein NADFUDRAFT_48657 [Nadsonia fulvescens var. elongata DSM 6958]